MVLVLKNHEMARLLPYRELLSRLIEAVETAFREFGNQLAVNRPRSRMYIPSREPNTFYWFNNIAGIVPAFRAMALRIDSSLAREVTHNAHRSNFYSSSLASIPRRSREHRASQIRSLGKNRPATYNPNDPDPN